MEVRGGYLDAEISPIYHAMFFASLVLICLFTLGCAINMVLVGDKSDKQQRKDLRRELDELQAFIRDSQVRISELEAITSQYMRTIRPRSINSLSEARQIIRALAVRLEEVQALLATKRKIDLIDAFELMESDLDVTENCFETLIGAAPTPPLRPEHWLPTVRNLLDSVKVEIERVAA